MHHIIAALVISVLSLAAGSFFYLRPQQCIDIQKRFYFLINWRMEPVSLKKEIRNTKLMGLMLLFVVIAIWSYLLIAR